MYIIIGASSGLIAAAAAAGITGLICYLVILKQKRHQHDGIHFSTFLFSKGLFDYRIRIRIHRLTVNLGSDSLGKSNDLGVSNVSRIHFGFRFIVNPDPDPIGPNRIRTKITL